MGLMTIRQTGNERIPRTCSAVLTRYVTDKLRDRQTYRHLATT